jgi:hypothetical protein
VGQHQAQIQQQRLHLAGVQLGTAVGCQQLLHLGSNACIIHDLQAQPENSRAQLLAEWAYLLGWASWV